MKLSRLLQVGLLLTFFLPFFRQCSPITGQSKKELEIQRIDDSIKVATFIDSVKSINPDCNVDSLLETRFNPTNEAKSTNLDSITKDSISTLTDDKKRDNRFTLFMSSLLYPNDNYSGIGYFIGTIIWIIYYAGTTLAFILWIIGLILKYKNRNLYHLINIIGLILFFFTYFDKVKFDFKLWGYWVSFSFAVIMIIYDIIMFIKDKNKKTVA